MDLANYVPTDFRLDYPAKCAYVLVRAAGMPSGQLSQMEPLGEARWGVTLKLQPGDYWCRYYVNDGATTILVPGWNEKIVGSAHGWDAAVHVDPKPEKKGKCGSLCSGKQCRVNTGCACRIGSRGWKMALEV